MPPTTEEDREERAEKRRLATRAERIHNVWKVLSPTKPKTVKEISAETGYSVPLVRSTLNFISRNLEDRDGTPLGYDPRTNEWRIARTYRDAGEYVEWLGRHLSTRTHNLHDLLEVVAGTWPDDVPVDLLVAISKYEDASRTLDDALGFYGVRIAERRGPSVTRPIVLHG